MAEYIEREKFINRIKKMAVSGYFSEDMKAICINIAEDIPEADVVEVKHGYWKKDYEFEDLGLCSVCNSTGDKEEPYCSYCGAKMDGDKNGQTKT